MAKNSKPLLPNSGRHFTKHYLVINIPPFPCPYLLLAAYNKYKEISTTNSHWFPCPRGIYFQIILSYPSYIFISKTPLYFCQYQTLPLVYIFCSHCEQKYLLLLTFLAKKDPRRNGFASCCFSPLCIFHSQGGFIPSLIYSLSPPLSLSKCSLCAGKIQCIFEGFRPFWSVTLRSCHLFCIENQGTLFINHIFSQNVFKIYINQELSSHSLQREFTSRKFPIVRAQTAATTSPTFTPAAAQGKKTLRKGTVIITGASSGLGLASAKSLAESGKWHVIMACRDFLKAEKAAKSAGMAKENYTIMHLDLSSLESVRQFVDNFKRSGQPLDVLVCNAAIYQPTAREPSFTADGFELSVGTNHLGHFLLSRLLLDDMQKSDYPSKRLIIVGSITGIAPLTYERRSSYN